MSNHRKYNTVEPKILIVDDTLSNLQLLSRILTEYGYVVRPASNGRIALRSVEIELPDLILLDVKMPDMDGFEVCRNLKSNEKSRDIPVIFISALSESAEKVEGFKAGGVDFITKPFDREEVLARVSTHLRLRELTEHLERKVRERTEELLKVNKKIKEEIKERKQTEKALKASEQNYHEIFDKVNDGLFIHDKNSGIIIDANKKVCELFEYTHEELLGLTISDLSFGEYPYTMEEAIKWVQKAVDEGPQIFEWLSKKKSGELFWAEVNLKHSEVGGVGRVMAVIRDITERKKSDLALMESEEKFRSYINVAPAVILCISSDLKIIEFNPVAEQIYGKKREDVLGKNYFNMFVPKEVREIVKADIQKVLGGVPTRNFENPIVSADGSQHMMSWNVDRLLDSKNNPVGIVAIGLDITERKQAEEKLKASERDLADAQRIAHIGTWRWEIPQDKVVVTNETYRLFGFEYGTEIKFETFLNKVIQSDRERVRNAVQIALKNEKPYEIEYKIQIEGEIRIHHSRGNIFWDENGNPLRMIGTVQDITERKQVEEKLKASEHELAEAQRIAHIGSWRWEIEQEKLYVSDEAHRMFSVSKQTTYDFDIFLNKIIEEDRLRAQKLIENMLNYHEPFEIEYKILNEGEIRIHYSRGNVFRDENDKPVRVIGTVQDITERKQAEEALKASERTYREIFDNVTDGLAVQDIDTLKLIDVNEKTCDMYGFTREEFLSTDMSRLEKNKPLYTFEQQKIWIQKTINEGPQTFEWVNYKKNGEPVTIEVSLKKALISGTERILVVFRDITERKRVEQIQLIQRDIGVALSSAENIKEILIKILESLQQIDEIDSGGIYLVDDKGALTLAAHKGISDNIVQNASFYDCSSMQSEMVLRGENLYIDLESDEKYFPEWLKKEKIKTYSVVPVKYKHDIIASLNLISHSFQNFSHYTRNALESISTQIGNVIGRLKIEMALKESEQRYRSLIESSPVSIHIIFDSKIVYINPKSIETLGGSTPEEFIGKDAIDFTHPDYHRIGKERRDALYRGETVAPAEQKFIRMDGEIRDVEVSSSCIEYKGKMAIQVVYNDITERKRSEEALRKSEERFRTVIEASKDAMISISESGLVTVFNKAAEIIFGLQREDMIGQPLDRLMPKKFRNKHSDYVRSYFSTGTPNNALDKTIELVALRGNGTEFPIDLSLSKGEFESESFVLAVIRDISERKQIEEKLTHQSRAIEASMDGIAVLNKNLIYIYVNKAHASIFGYDSASEISGKNCDFIHRNDKSKMLKNEVLPILYEKGSWRGEINGDTKDGRSIPLEVSLTLLDGNDIICIVRDITERKRLEEQFFQAQKMESVGRLAGGVAHDFNNLLSVIGGNAEIALENMHQETVAYGELTEIKIAADRAANLTRQLLTFSRRQIIKPQIINLNTVLVEMNKMHKRLIGEDIELILIPGEKLWYVKVDMGQIEQLISNLVVNARDAMPKGGKLIIETQNVQLDSGFVKKEEKYVSGKFVMISVSDTGIGMDEELKSHIFEPFFTTKEKGRGTGLGLATCYGIIKQNNGHIWVYSEPGKGTTFKIYFPKAKGVTTFLPEDKKLSESPGGTETILVVEDEPSLRNMIEKLLTGKGYTILKAENGEDAIQIALQHKNQKIDLLLTDVIMPRMGGRELSESLLQSIDGLKVIFVSGYTDDAIVRNSILKEGVNFLHKPFSPGTLVEKVREVLDG